MANLVDSSSLWSALSWGAKTLAPLSVHLLSVALCIIAVSSLR